MEPAIFLAEVARECQRCRVPRSIENPSSSKIWGFHPIYDLCGLPGVLNVVFEQCQYSVPWKKPTMILPSSSGLVSLEALRKIVSMLA